MRLADKVATMARRGAPLPYDAEVEYLESTGIQRIVTGIRPSQCIDQNGLAIVRFQTAFEYGNVTSRQLNGMQGSWYFGPCNGKWQIGNGGNGTWNIDFESGKKYTLDATFRYGTEFSDVLVTINDGEEANLPISGYTSGSFFSFQNEGLENISAFSLNDGILPSSCKMWFYKVYSHDDLLIDLIPVRVGNIGCMFDRRGIGGFNSDGTHRTDGLYFNRGTGAFVIGPDVVSSRGGGTKCLTPRRSYRRLARPSARFCARSTSQRWEVAA